MIKYLVISNINQLQLLSLFLLKLLILVSAAACLNRHGMQQPLGVADLERELGLHQRAQVTVDLMTKVLVAIETYFTTEVEFFYETR
jgi:hypothetical protein